MELIATARFKKAMDRAQAATAYTARLTELVAELARGGTAVTHPLLEQRPETRHATLLVLTANRGLCGGYNSGVVRQALPTQRDLASKYAAVSLEISGKRGANTLKARKVAFARSFTQFDDQPKFDDVLEIANRYLAAYLAGEIDRLDVAYTKFLSPAKQIAVVETLLPFSAASVETAAPTTASAATIDTKTGMGEAPFAGGPAHVEYEFLPSAESILEEIVPEAFRIKLFQCFLDAAVSEQIARMVAMKSATENAGDMIKSLSRTYNRARQARITGENHGSHRRRRSAVEMMNFATLLEPEDLDAAIVVGKSETRRCVIFVLFSRSNFRPGFANAVSG